MSNSKIIKYVHNKFFNINFVLSFTIILMSKILIDTKFITLINLFDGFKKLTQLNYILKFMFYVLSSTTNTEDLNLHNLSHLHYGDKVDYSGKFLGQIFTSIEEVMQNQAYQRSYCIVSFSAYKYSL
jgi:hypothetical protein